MKAVSDALLRRSGVAEVNVDLQANRVTIVPDATLAFPLDSIPFAIRGAGFRPGAMTIRAHGEIVDDGDGRAFRIAGWPETIPLAPDAPTPQAGTLVARYDWEATPGRLASAED